MVLDEVKKKSPLIYNVTNYVSVNDVANVILGVGGKPIMSNAIGEVDDLVNHCDGINLNVGTIDNEIFTLMKKACLVGNKNNKPICLDMVGVNASKYRLECVLELLNSHKFKVIKGNYSELIAIARKELSYSGVDNDASLSDDELIELSCFISKKYHCIVVGTGKIDVVSDGDKNYLVSNGCSKMSLITGTGCMLNGIISCFISCNDKIESILEAVCLMGIAGEKANKVLGNGSYKVSLLDEISLMNSEVMKEMVNYASK